MNTINRYKIYFKNVSLLYCNLYVIKHWHACTLYRVLKVEINSLPLEPKKNFTVTIEHFKMSNIDFKICSLSNCAPIARDGRFRFFILFVSDSFRSVFFKFCRKIWLFSTENYCFKRSSNLEIFHIRSRSYRSFFSELHHAFTKNLVCSQKYFAVTKKRCPSLPFAQFPSWIWRV